MSATVAAAGEACVADRLRALGWGESAVQPPQEASISDAVAFLLRRLSGADAAASDAALPADARQLARALVDNKCLRTLSVRGNKIGDDGARLFARGLRANDTLQQLDLGDNGLGEAAARELANAARLNMTVRAARRARAGEATAGELTRPRAHPARAAARAGVGGQPAHRRRGAAAAGCGAQQAPRAVRLGLGSHRLVLLARCC